MLKKVAHDFILMKREDNVKLITCYIKSGIVIFATREEIIH